MQSIIYETKSIGLAKTRPMLFVLLFESRALSCLHALSLCHIQNRFAKANALGGYLNQLVLGDKFDRFLEGKLNGGDLRKLFIRAGGAERRQMLFLSNVDLNIIGLRVFANDHTCIHVGSRADKEGAAILRLIKTIGGGNTGFGSNE